MVGKNEMSEQEKECINLESSCFEELGRTPVVGVQDEEESVVVQEIATGENSTYRCDSTERELLKNHFPVDA